MKNLSVPPARSAKRRRLHQPPRPRLPALPGQPVLIPDPDDAIHFVLAQYLRVPGRDDAGRRPMATADTSPVLYVIACGAGPARQLPAFVRAAQGEGWDVCVITTPAGATFLDADRMAELTGHPVRVRYKHPDEPDVLPPADAFAIAPATFN